MYIYSTVALVVPVSEMV